METTVERPLTDRSNKRPIDPSVFEEKGKLYALWSGWKEDDDPKENIYIAAMANAWTVAGDRVKLSPPKYSWEKRGSEHPPYVAVNEAPEVLQHDGRIFIIHSATGCWTDDYALAMLTAQADIDLLNPKSWTKSEEPVFSKSGGGPCLRARPCQFFQIARRDGGLDDLPCERGSGAQGCGNHRSPRIQRFTWNADGSPNFGSPVDLGELTPKPSGHP